MAEDAIKAAIEDYQWQESESCVMTENNIGVFMIHLTENAATHISNYLQNRGKGEGIRIGVKTSGCSGLAYVLEFVDDIDTHDQVFENNSVLKFC